MISDTGAIVGTNSEDSFISSLRVERELPEGWQVAIGIPRTLRKAGARHFHRRRRAGHGAGGRVRITAQPTVRKDFLGGLWLRVELPFTCWLLAAPLDDYWEFGPVRDRGLRCRELFRVHGLSYGASYQPHSTWVALDPYRWSVTSDFWRFSRIGRNSPGANTGIRTGTCTLLPV
jgi:hypothetical protein